MSVDPVTASAIGSFTTLSFQLGKKSVSGFLTSIYDSWIIWKFRRHVKNQETDNVIYEDIYSIKSRLIDAILNHDFSRMKFLLYGLLDESGNLSTLSQLGMSITIEEVIENFSNQPFVIEDGLFTIEASFNSFLEKWNKKFHPITFGNDFLVPSTSRTNNEKIFLDYTFQGAAVSVNIFYYTCLMVGGKSIENLIRIANHLHFAAAAYKSFIFSNPYYNRIFLIVIIQIAAKAHKLNLDPTREKMIEILKFANQVFVKDAFQWALDKKGYPFIQMGNMTLFLATKDEIETFNEFFTKSS